MSFDRATALRRLADERFDVLVVGGGITGAGVALDAATRGLRTALVERHDIASGTSSKSSKLVHGGIRYLQQREVGLVYEALAERQILRKTAPHLVRVLPFLLPVFTRDGLLPRRIARLLGATVIVTGLSPEIAQTLVTIGVDLSKMNTVGDLQGGIELAERVLGYKVVLVEEGTPRSR